MEEFDVVIVGAGFAGMYALHRVRELGLRGRVFEAGGDVGGTWYWNRYPGARCDVESLEYSYQFSEELQQEWVWTEKYSAQPEILSYANHVADRFDLRRDIRFDTRVTAAVFDDAAARWTVTTDRGDEVTASFVVMCTGCLSSTNVPQFAGMESFVGEIFHTGKWPHDGVDFTGKQVGVIGTGSSGIQAIPIIAQQAAHLTVFQRTAQYSIPARNAPLDREYEAKVKADYKAFRRRNSRTFGAIGGGLVPNGQSVLEASDDERAARFEERWNYGGFSFLGAFGDLAIVDTANEYAADFVRDKIRSIVKNPDTAAKLMPTTMIGCKRLCLDTNYFETYNRDNVTLVDISVEPIERITPTGIQAGAAEHRLDCIVFATGFDAMTGALLAIDVRGRGGLSLRDAWAAGPRTYLGLGVAGFPNLFTVCGPGSPSVLTNMMVAIEQHVDWIAACIDHLRSNGFRLIEATAAAQEAWVEHVNGVAEHTIYPTCNSWYLGANVPGKTRVFMPLPGFPGYVKKCDEVVASGYQGFVLA
ncbi:MAG: flavin-containing monooxygenase [Acidimicrobiia bacterium]